MSQANTMSSGFKALLKEFYTDEVVADATYEKNPFYALVPKNEMVTGAHYNVPVIYGQGQGRSRNFSYAQGAGAVSGTNSAVFQAALLSNWADATISSELILSTGNDRGAFLKASKQVMDGQLKNLAVDMEMELLGDGSGSRGQIAVGSSTSLSTGVLTLAVPQQAFNFEVGMQLAASSVLTGTGSLRVNGSGITGNYAGLLVIGVDRINGTITTGSSAGVAGAPNDATNGLVSLTAGDYLFQVGDKGNALLGIQAWIPYGGPAATGDSFTNSAVNRAVDPVRLAGLWFNGQSMSTEECLIKAAAAVSQQGDDIDHYIMSYPKFAALASSLGSKVQITELRATPSVGFEAIEIMGPAGPIKVVPDRSCPPTSIFGIKKDTWELSSVRKAIFVWDLDGRNELRQGSDSGLELRFMSYSNLFCHKPSANINIAVQSA